MLIDKGDISNYLGFNIKKISDGTFELLQSHPIEKIINHVVLAVYASLKSIEVTTGKPLIYKDEYILARKCVWNYREEVGMLSYLQGSTGPEISMAVHQYTRFSIIRFLCTNAPSDASQINSRARLHMWIYQMDVDN